MWKVDLIVVWKPLRLSHTKAIESTWCHHLISLSCLPKVLMVSLSIRGTMCSLKPNAKCARWVKDPTHYSNYFDKKENFHQIISILTGSNPELRILETYFSIIIRSEVRLSLRTTIFVGFRKQGNIVRFAKDLTVNDDSEFQRSYKDIYLHELEPYNLSF